MKLLPLGIGEHLDEQLAFQVLRNSFKGFRDYLTIDMIRELKVKNTEAAMAGGVGGAKGMLDDREYRLSSITSTYSHESLSALDKGAAEGGGGATTGGAWRRSQGRNNSSSSISSIVNNNNRVASTEQQRRSATGPTVNVLTSMTLTAGEVLKREVRRCKLCVTLS